MLTGEVKSAYHRNRRRSVVAWLRSLRVECKKCGEKDPVVLDFDHRDPAQKSFKIVGSHCYSRSRESILKEVAKCDVLCANCHRRKTYRERGIIA